MLKPSGPKRAHANAAFAASIPIGISRDHAFLPVADRPGQQKTHGRSSRGLLSKSILISTSTNGIAGYDDYQNYLSNFSKHCEPKIRFVAKLVKLQKTAAPTFSAGIAIAKDFVGFPEVCREKLHCAARFCVYV